VVLAPGSTVDGEHLRAFVNARHGEHVTPVQIIAMDRVPVTEQGKPNRVRIAALLGEQREAMALR
jgi:acyl-coenzyme A synthetase/AMP-(fatty) acid ligase